MLGKSLDLVLSVIKILVEISVALLDDLFQDFDFAGKFLG